MEDDSTLEVVLIFARYNIAFWGSLWRKRTLFGRKPDCHIDPLL
jgi:hypothetical protein